MKQLLILFTLFTISSLSCLAQSYIVTDIKTSGITENELQEKKSKMLGAKFDMSFYDSAVKIKVINTENEYTTIVLNISPDKEFDYFCQIGESRYYLYLHKSFGEMNSVTFASATVGIGTEIFWYTLKKKY